jgi:hypothetical protein
LCKPEIWRRICLVDPTAARRGKVKITTGTAVSSGRDRLMAHLWDCTNTAFNNGHDEAAKGYERLREAFSETTDEEYDEAYADCNEMDL